MLNRLFNTLFGKLFAGFCLVILLTAAGVWMVRLLAAGIIRVTAQPGEFNHIVLQYLAHMGRAKMLNRNIGGFHNVDDHF